MQGSCYITHLQSRGTVFEELLLVRGFSIKRGFIFAN